MKSVRKYKTKINGSKSLQILPKFPNKITPVRDDRRNRHQITPLCAVKQLLGEV